MISKYFSDLNTSLFKRNTSLILGRSLITTTSTNPSQKYYSFDRRVVEPSADDTAHEKLTYNPQEEAKQAKQDMSGESEPQKVPPEAGIDEETLKQALRYEHEHPSHKSHKHRRDEKWATQQSAKDISISEE